MPTEMQYVIAKWPQGDQPGRTEGFDRVGLNVNSPNRFGLPPVHVAFAAGDIKQAQQLLARGADPSIPAVETGHPVVKSTVHDIVLLHAAEGRVEIAQGLNDLLKARGLAVDTVSPNREEARENLMAIRRFRENCPALCK